MSSVDTIVDCDVVCDDTVLVLMLTVMMEIANSSVKSIGVILFDSCIVFLPLEFEQSSLPCIDFKCF